MTKEQINIIIREQQIKIATLELNILKAQIELKGAVSELGEMFKWEKTAKRTK